MAVGSGISVSSVDGSEEGSPDGSVDTSDEGSVSTAVSPSLACEQPSVKVVLSKIKVRINNSVMCRSKG